MVPWSCERWRDEVLDSVGNNLLLQMLIKKCAKRMGAVVDIIE